MQINTNYANLQDSYLFLTIAKKVAAYTQAHPENRIIRMGIGDVTQPLVPAVIEPCTRRPTRWRTRRRSTLFAGPGL